jgi:dTDP-glucose pyrophosphorylase
MNVIIPMTGYGSRFVAAGYQELKPFIRVMGRPVIEWIVKDMYPADVNIIFVCRGEHLMKDASMRERLLLLAPEAKIVSIEDWVKKGPVYDVLRGYRELLAQQAIDAQEPCIINYCDFYMQWDYAAFAKEAAERGCDGAVPCYSGFHPNLLPEKNYYASCLTDAQDDLIEIREKYSFEKDKTKAKHSPGVYYFAGGAVMEKYCQILTEHEECAINGEYYASLPYNFMVQDGLKVWVPVNVEYFCQWGTPEDMQEFVYWTDLIRKSEAAPHTGGAESPGAEEEMQGRILIPMAGAGQRFADAGYTVHKPAIMTVDRATGQEKPMVVCATKDLPGVAADGSNVIYVDRNFHQTDGVEDAIRAWYPQAAFITVDHLTEGQACTCMLAEPYLDPEQPLLIAGCDNGMDIDRDAFDALTKECDCIVFTYRHNEAVLANPNAYGWMIADADGNITGTSIKKAISDSPMEDPAVVATFWFRRAAVFIEATKKMIAENDRINGEFYVDQTVKHVLDLGYRAKIFDIDRYVGWGTPADYEGYQKTWNYFKAFLGDKNIFGEA